MCLIIRISVTNAIIKTAKDWQKRIIHSIYPFPAVRGDCCAIERMAYEFCEDAASEGVVYVEARYSPHYLSNTTKQEFSAGLGTVSPRDAVHCVNRGFKRGQQDFGITVRSILACIRNYPGEGDFIMTAWMLLYIEVKYNKVITTRPKVYIKEHMCRGGGSTVYTEKYGPDWQRGASGLGTLKKHTAWAKRGPELLSKNWIWPWHISKETDFNYLFYHVVIQMSKPLPIIFRLVWYKRWSECLFKINNI